MMPVRLVPLQPMNLPIKIYQHAFLPATLLFAFSCLIASCGNPQPDNPPPVPQLLSEKQVKQELIPSHRMFVKQEEDEIKQFIKQHNYKMQSTPTGIYYMITSHGSGIQPETKDIVTVAYSISLLDGTLCYNSEKDGPKEFKVGEDVEESGVHQAVQLMHQGDRAMFIIPSYLAAGLIGDRNKIPPGAVVVYDIRLLAVKKAG
jgi:FKBP-type peptidyl-prolyl cis-trans isomerase